MKKKYIVLIVVACVLVFLVNVSVFVAPFLIDGFSTNECEIDVESYRLEKDANGNDIIIVKYNFKNEGKTATALAWECYIQLYQDGVGLVEVYELPEDCNYNTDDQYRELKGGASYGVEIAYELVDTVTDVEVVIEDYGFILSDTETEYIKISK